jgi:glycosyltransferase involved in cell wall biosynthesis
MVKLSVVIIAFNEEKDIERCLNTVNDVADEILVVDSMSTDKTPEICKAHDGVSFISNQF